MPACWRRMYTARGAMDGTGRLAGLDSLWPIVGIRCFRARIEVIPRLQTGLSPAGRVDSVQDPWGQRRSARGRPTRYDDLGHVGPSLLFRRRPCEGECDVPGKSQHALKVELRTPQGPNVNDSICSAGFSWVLGKILEPILQGVCGSAERRLPDRIPGNVSSVWRARLPPSRFGE